MKPRIRRLAPMTWVVEIGGDQVGGDYYSWHGACGWVEQIYRRGLHGVSA